MIYVGFHPIPRLRNFLKDDLVRGAAPEPPLKKLFEKSFLRIFKNFEKGDIFRFLSLFTARAYPYRRDF